MTEENFRMSSHRPYLLRALVEWINDNGMTPHVMVDAGVAGVQVPASAVNDGRVVLNIAERAVMRLHIDNETLSFTARFSGVSFPVSVPIAAILAVYARETGHGMALPDDIAGSDSPPDDDMPPPPGPPDDIPVAGKRPHLRVVK
ncbi:ClpXP protease specificity-enhancing factor [Stenotrophomonas sp. YIM B06876]|uniref:ClpXP protease specificity-enhancing factor n=1 Tax=Stenotrophomonas sp. YIM B06876 TaxID=3060211 RepID=UPI00273970A1|nr:ClpXP protease specificity-enhancing factor [Stenotrophomonas sp. YIM B06876]